MLRDAKTDDVRVLDVRKRDCDFTDEFVIATARSKLHAQTAAQAIVYQVRHPCSSISFMISLLLQLASALLELNSATRNVAKASACSTAAILSSILGLL